MRRIQNISLLVMILLSTFLTEVSAQEETSDVNILTLTFPESLAGYTVLARDASGATLSEGKIDATGSVEISYVDGINDILVNTDVLQKAPEETTQSYSLVECASFAAGSAILFGIIAYLFGRRRVRKVLSSLRDEVYEESLD